MAAFSTRGTLGFDPPIMNRDDLEGQLKPTHPQTDYLLSQTFIYILLPDGRMTLLGHGSNSRNGTRMRSSATFVRKTWFLPLSWSDVKTC